MQEQINNSSMLKVGTILRGTYRIDSYLSSGGFGNTYVATNIEFEERFAIKEFFMKGVTERDETTSIVSVSNAGNVQQFEEQREKFKKEARRLRKLKNEHIVKVHDLFEENGTAYYVMDFVDGENLAERLKRVGKPMKEQEVRDILPQILDALKSVHDSGIWHLDLKPANILIDKCGIVKLIDFGASKQLNAQKGGATTSTAISYTNGYAPREQMEQNYDKFGPWTDIYALGATLYKILTTNNPPLPSDIDDEGTNAFSFPSDVSVNMKKLIIKMMTPSKKNRAQNVAEVEKHLLYDNENDENTLIDSKVLVNGSPKNNDRIIPISEIQQDQESVIDLDEQTIFLDTEISTTNEEGHLYSVDNINEQQSKNENENKVIEIKDKQKSSDILFIASFAIILFIIVLFSFFISFSKIY